MIFWIAILICLYLIWTLVFSGLLWKLLLFVGGWVGIYSLLRVYLPDSAQVALILAGHGYSWAAVVPTVICVLALATTRE